MLPRLLLDENIPADLASALRERGHDVVHVREAGLEGAEDPEVLDFAVRSGRAVLTHDAKDFLPLAAEFAASGRRHFGIMLTRERTFRGLRSAVLRLLSERSAASLHDAVVWLD